MNQLQLFYENKPMYEAVKSYLGQFVEKEALDAIFNEKDVSGFSHAKQVVENAFSRLREEFEPPAIPNITNQAR